MTTTSVTDFSYSIPIKSGIFCLFEDVFAEFSVKEVKKNQEILNLGFKSCFDYDKIKVDTYFRTRISGDKLFLEKRNLSKSLKKFLVEKKVPTQIKNILPVIANGNEILWVCGMYTSNKIKVDKSTKRILIIEFKGDNIEERYFKSTY